jgi:hypothetical protein
VVNEYDGLDLEGLGEQLLRRLADNLDDDAVTEALEELEQAWEWGTWELVARHLDGGTSDLFEELTDAGVDIRAVLAYLVGLTAVVFDGYTDRVPWETLHVFLGSYVESNLRHHWTVALEVIAPLESDIQDLLKAWRVLAHNEIPDEIVRLEDGLYDSLKELDGELVHMGELDYVPEDSEDYDENTAATERRAEERLEWVRRLLKG